MDITPEFLSACQGKTPVDGRLEDAGANWWAARINGKVALVGWEVSPITEAAAAVLVNAGATFDNGGALLNGNTYTFEFNGDNFLGLA